MRGAIETPEFFAALAHGRRSRMAEGGTLEGLCGVRSISDLGRSTLRGEVVESAGDFQRAVQRQLKQEVTRLARMAKRAETGYLEWLPVRYLVEDVKLWLRTLLTGAGAAALEPWLGSAGRRELALRKQGKWVEQLDMMARVLPRGGLRRDLRLAADRYGDESPPFFYEAALDRAYLQEGLVRVDALHGEDHVLLRPLVRQEADIFHLRLVVRGKLGYGLKPADLAPFYVVGGGLPRVRWEGMLAESDARRVAQYVVGIAVDAWPREAVESAAGKPDLEAALLETLAHERFRRLANRAFRSSPMGFAAVAAYVHLRHVEVANLIRVSEGVRLKVAAEELRRWLVPRANLQEGYV